MTNYNLNSLLIFLTRNREKSREMNQTQMMNEKIEEYVRNLELLGDEMCYNTSAEFMKFFPSNSEEKTFDLFKNFSQYLSSSIHSGSQVFNIEIHLTTDISEREKMELLKGTRPKGLMKHITSQPGKLRLFTHAFNIVLLDSQFCLYQSWGRAHSYRRVIRGEISDLPRFLNDLSVNIHNIFLNPSRLFQFFGLSASEFNKMCEYSQFRSLMAKSRDRTTQLQILSERKMV